MNNKKIALTLMYDGTDFCGWQVQPNAPSVQGAVQDALERVLGYRPDVSGCSRTDSGVHANMYVCHISAEGVNMPPQALMRAVNANFKGRIACYDADCRDSDFHARYSCTGKEYLYKIWNASYRNPFLEGYSMYVPKRIDDESLAFVGEEFCGTHDFKAFMSKGSKITDDTVRTVEYFRTERKGDLLEIYVKADGFLYNMVRIMVGTYLEAAKGRLRPGDITDIINSKSRNAAGDTARPEGLFLNKVFYGEDKR